MKDAQLDYLNVTMFGFLGGASGERLNADILLSRELRQVYEEEKATALGVPYATPTARVALVPANPSVEGTPVATASPASEGDPAMGPIMPPHWRISESCNIHPLLCVRSASF